MSPTRDSTRTSSLVDVNPNQVGGAGVNNVAPPPDQVLAPVVPQIQAGLDRQVPEGGMPQLPRAPAPPGGGADPPAPQVPNPNPALVVANNLGGLLDNVVEKDPGARQAVQRMRVFTKMQNVDDPIAESQAGNLRRFDSITRLSPQSLINTNN